MPSSNCLTAGEQTVILTARISYPVPLTAYPNKPESL